METNLQDVLRKDYAPASAGLPHPLPIGHVAPARLFADIIDSGALKPTKCKTFGDERLYLYYGGIYYRSSIASTRNEDRLPVGFLFDPAQLKQAKCYYPFDTGAVAENKFGEFWREKLSPIERFQVAPEWGVQTPSVITDALYISNTNYLEGKVNPVCNLKGDLLTLLHEFLTADLSEYDADQRQSTTECHYLSSLELTTNSSLLWIGYPNALQKQFQRLCDSTFPSVPRCFPYTFKTPFRPSDLEAKLEQAAREEVERFL